MESLCVFIGSNLGRNSVYLDSTKQLGKELAKRKIKLIYGGGKLGLMGILADTVLENGGQVLGVITKHLYEQEAHLELSELQVVDSMQERKKIMMQLADGFMALPGGLGTLEEIFEIWNAYKLKIHNKPCGLLNIDNYFNKLIEFMEYSIHEGFLKQELFGIIKIINDPIILLSILIKQNTLLKYSSTVKAESISAPKFI